MSLTRRILNLFSRDHIDREIDAELQAHLDLRTDDNIAAGMSTDQARRDARLRLGNPVAHRERTSAADAALTLDAFGRDIRYALRQFKKSPAFALTAVVILALGIGANTAIFSVMHAVLLRMLPAHHPEQLFYLTHQGAPPIVNVTGDWADAFGINVYQRLREDRSVFSDVVAYVPFSLRKTPVRFGDTPEEVRADEVSGNFFSALGVRMAVGQAFASADGDQHAPVAVLSYDYWSQRFQRDPSIIGRPIYLNGVPLTILGVTAPGFYGIESGGDATDLWVPLQNRPELNAWGIPPSSHTLYANPNWWCLMLMVRLRPGISQQQALARMDPAFAHAAWETVGKEISRREPMHLQLVPARGVGLSIAYFELPMKILMGMVVLVLVIACVNIALRIAARNAAREREFALRLALGAGRWPLFRQLLAESLLLVAAGVLLGWFFALEATTLLGRWADIGVSLAPDSVVLAFTLIVSAAVALLFGLWPLPAATSAPAGLALRPPGPQTSDSPTRALTGKILVAAQMAFCVALLFGAGLLIRTLRNYQTVHLGIDADHVLAFGVHPIGARNDAQMLDFYTQLLARIGALPGIRSATVAELRPGSGWTDGGLLTLDGRQYPYDNGRNMLKANTVGPGFFETLGIPILAGRGITAADTRNSMGVAVVNQTFASRYFDGQSPIGHHLGAGPGLLTIVGVAHDFKYQSADEEPTPMVWYSYQQVSAIENMDVEVHTTGDPATQLPIIRRVVHGIDPNAPLQKPIDLRGQFAESFELPTLFARLGAFFGALAALLVAVGLYGTLAYRVNRRTVEIGVRMALGAARSQVLWLILRQSLKLAAAGLVLGLPLAWFGSRLMRSMLYKLSPHDPASLAAAALGVVFVAALAALIPARRAASIDPMRALRSE
jgi:predicted permease